MTRCSRIQNPIGQLKTVTRIPTRTLVIIRYMYHICIYLLITFILDVVACTINIFNKTYLFSSFLIFFWWLRTFYNQVIFVSTSKAFPRRTYRTSVVRITIHTRFLLFFSDPFETFFCRMIRTSTKSALFLENVLFLTIYSTT